MGILAATRTHLATGDTILSLMGQSAPDRIRPESIPQGLVGSFVVLYRPSTTYNRLLAGQTQQLRVSRVRADVWAQTADDRELLAEAVRRRMRAFKGRFADVEIVSVSVPLTDIDASEDNVDGAEGRDWRTTLEWDIHHRNLEDV